MKKNTIPIHHQGIFLAAAAGLLSGAALAWLNPGFQSFRAFVSGFMLAGISAWILIRVCLWHGVNRQAGFATALAFSLRLVIGIILFVMLPIHGYDEAPPNNGYLYLDAFERDSDAWELAASNRSLATAFQNEFATDQYGGLLSLSAGIYRLFSPDAHRPLLILIVTAFFAALGIPFLWAGLKMRWGKKTANIATWIFALYPESVILGASQMREPILIGLSAIALWGVLQWRNDRKTASLALVLTAVAMIFISIKASAAIWLSLLILFWIENVHSAVPQKWRVASYLLLSAVVLAGLFISWSWLLDSSRWDLFLMESSSGRIQWEVELIGARFRAPFIIGYGVTQPVLPAAIIYPGLPIMRTIAIYRSLGWYLLVPALVAGFLLVWKQKNRKERNLLLLLFVFLFIWVFISSARAGGDQWDNPRYRSIFLVWMSLLGGWSWIETRKQRSPWLWRLLFLEIVYIGFFIHWYLSRYFSLFKRMDFWPMVFLLGGIGGAVIIGGLVFDLIYNRIRRINKG